MEELTFFRNGWLDKINKTIAMITASPEYQRYIAKKRRQALAYQDSLVAPGEGRHYGKRGRKDYSQKFCLVCEKPLTRRSSFQMCHAHARAAVVADYRSSLDIGAIAVKYGCNESTVVTHLRDGSRSRAARKASMELVSSQ